MTTHKQERSMSNRTEHEQQAYDMGRDGALAAASWIIDGNTPQEHIARLLTMLDDGDPEADQYMPTRPDLSGEWADQLTPYSLLDRVGLTWDETDDATIEAVCEAFEAGVMDTFEVECERILREAIA